MNDCNHPQCRQVHLLLDSLLEMMELPPMEGIVSVGKAVVVCQEIEILRAELAALKTPHCCDDCAHHRWINQTDGACGNMQTGVYRVDGGQSWLCGHFQAKGTS